jgi:hypothetical protein
MPTSGAARTRYAMLPQPPRPLSEQGAPMNAGYEHLRARRRLRPTLNWRGGWATRHTNYFTGDKPTSTDARPSARSKPLSFTGCMQRTYVG